MIGDVCPDKMELFIYFDSIGDEKNTKVENISLRINQTLPDVNYNSIPHSY